ncbi:hypothetical protein K2173_025306 [Erythroxylum novogranatense]|uniref:Uncharacterized protein n=1 Tax=Erythroxylum novogranatense TaxID=1862640 RepID=A0AAV8UDG2_9ROSI|nr:hypothetical protein K2173_025306 [Erythroxylum novogranatense]
MSGRLVNASVFEGDVEGELRRGGQVDASGTVHHQHSRQLGVSNRKGLPIARLQHVDTKFSNINVKRSSCRLYVKYISTYKEEAIPFLDDNKDYVIGIDKERRPKDAVVERKTDQVQSKEKWIIESGGRE